jgi:hypothetical protein
MKLIHFGASILSVFFFINCAGDNLKEKEKSDKTNPAITDTEERPLKNKINNENQPHESKVPIENESLVYKLENDTILQILEIKLITNQQVNFALSSTNKPKQKTFKIEGIARSKGTADPEIDEDEEGNAYPAISYLFENDCWLALRIDMQSKERVQINEAECEDLHDQCCPFGSMGILKRVQ